MARSRLAAVLLWSVLALTPDRVLAQAPSVSPTRETHPVPHGGDAADDPALWLHPTTPASSLLIGTDKDGGIGVYDLTGAELQFLPHGELNNVDVRYNFSLDGQTIDLVVASNRTNDSIAVYRVDPDPVGNQWLVPAGVISVSPFQVYGICLYANRLEASFFAFVTSEEGHVEQWQLLDGAGVVGGAKVRSLEFASTVEACVADDWHRRVYFAEESAGIWRAGAEPDDGSAPSLLDATGPQGHLTADVEGLGVYHGLGGSGFLLASSQGSSDYVVYERASGGYVGRFRIGAGNGIDGASDTDGIEVTSVSLGAGFPNGLFVAQDGLNTDPAANQNFKLVPWESIAQAFDPPLDVPTGWNPRPQCGNWIDDDGDGLVDWDGGGAGGPDPQCVERPWRDRETGRSCGLGFELSLPLAGLLAASLRPVGRLA
jgi:3-phytase